LPEAEVFPGAIKIFCIESRRKKMKAIKYSNTSNQDLITVLRARVMEYFKEKNISSYGNLTMFFKSVIILSTYIFTYLIILFSGIENFWALLGLWSLMGMASAGIGLSVMHDANHGSYSKNRTVNKWLGFLLNFIGGSATNWKLQHNYLHHAYTNIEGMDEDIAPGPVMRLSPHSKWRSFHRWQHIYGWFLYSLMTLSWVVSKDFLQLKRYKDKGLLQKQGKSYRYLLWELIISKLVFFTYLLVIPIIFSPAAWWLTLLFFIFMHMIQGFVLTIVFQPAHVMPSSEYPLPDETGNMENSWALHQIYTTTNFSPGSRIFSWYIGGLNYQIEHHLFPNICHVHYRNISPIVRNTIMTYGAPYHVKKTFIDALKGHYEMLWKLGKNPNP
jgi:linoleoyl-CoA desaturase